MAAPTARRRWVWFFAVLWLTGFYVFRAYWQKQQLTRQRLDEARSLWDQNRPRDYDLTYTKKGSTEGKFVVKVRGGKVKDVTLDGRALTRDDRPLDPRFYPRYDMSGLFDDLDEFLKRDAEPGRQRSIALARFDPQDGHLLQYTRKVPGTSELIELTDIVLTPLPGEPAGKKARDERTPKP